MKLSSISSQSLPAGQLVSVAGHARRGGQSEAEGSVRMTAEKARPHRVAMTLTNAGLNLWRL